MKDSDSASPDAPYEHDPKLNSSAGADNVAFEVDNKFHNFVS